MKKHSYRQTDVNKIDWTALKSKTEGRGVMFCVDVAKQNFAGVLASLEGETVCVVKWKHPQETAWLVEKLCAGLGVARMEVVMEPSGTYGDVLRWQFGQRGIPVYRVSPKQVHDRAESYDGVPSLHDAKAAHPSTSSGQASLPNCIGRNTARRGRKHQPGSAACKG